MNKFENKFKTFQNIDLLKIIEKSSDYQPEAVTAAKNEIENRKLSQKEIDDLLIDINTLKKEDLNRKQKQEELKNRIKDSTFSITSILTPIRNSKTSTDKIINLISFVFLGFILYQFYQQFGMLSFMFTNPGAEWDISIAGYIIPFGFLPIATFLFWKRKKIGWSLLTVFLTFSAINSIGIYIVTLKQQSNSLNLFDEYSPISYIYKLIFFGGALWGVTKPKVIEKFTISKRERSKTILITGSITVAIILLFLFKL